MLTPNISAVFSHVSKSWLDQYSLVGIHHLRSSTPQSIFRNQSLGSLRMDRKCASAAVTLMWVLSILESTDGDPNTKLLRWSCHLESDAQLAETPGRHKLRPIPGRGKFATGGKAWTVCSAELDEAACTACVNYALKLANLALDLLDIDSECSGEGVQLYLQSCKMRYVLNDFLSPPEVLYSVS